MSVVMASPTFSFDESKFIYKFVCDYYTENDFDLDSSFKEYFQNFVDSNSNEYNMYIYHRLRIKFKVNENQKNLSVRDYLCDILYKIIKTGMTD